MGNVKRLIKKLLPKSILSVGLRPYHFLRGVLALIIYQHPSRGMKIVMITGTNGKTTTSAILGKIFEAAGEKVGISTTAFYQIGDKTWLNDQNMSVSNPFAVQKTLREMKRAGVQRVIFEQTAHGIDQFRTLGVEYQAAAVTNLTQDHLDYFKTMENYAAVKAKLIQRKLEIIALNRDDDWYEFFAGAADEDSTVLTFGAHPDSDYQLTKVDYQPGGSKLSLSLRGQNLDVNLNLVGQFNALNALCATTLAHGLGISHTAIKNGLEALQHVPGRMETIDNDRGLQVIVDYAHATDALRAALETLRPITKGQIISVYGACGDRDKSKRPSMGHVGAQLSDTVIITDDEPYTENPAKIRSELLSGINDKSKIIEIGDRRQAIAKALEIAKPGDTIFIAGMGSEQFRTVGDGIKEPWDDRQATRDLLQNS